MKTQERSASEGGKSAISLHKRFRYLAEIAPVSK